MAVCLLTSSSSSIKVGQNFLVQDGEEVFISLSAKTLLKTTAEKSKWHTSTTEIKRKMSGGQDEISTNFKDGWRGVDLKSGHKICPKL